MSTEKPKVCIARSSYDLATHYLNAWVELIIKYAKKLGYHVIDIPEATKEKYERIVKAEEPSLFIGAGHGGYYSFAGQGREIVIMKCQNDDLLKQKICYLIACDTASELGPSTIDKGALAFIGWQEDFVFGVHRDYLDAPLEDPYAYSFFDSANSIAYSLLDGQTVKEAYETGIKTFDKWISFWKGVNDPFASQLITWLYWDRDNLIALTKEGLYTPPPTPIEIPVKMNLMPLIIIPMGLTLLYAIEKL